MKRFVLTLLGVVLVAPLHAQATTQALPSAPCNEECIIIRDDDQTTPIGMGCRQATPDTPHAVRDCYVSTDKPFSCWGDQNCTRSGDALAFTLIDAEGGVLEVLRGCRTAMLQTRALAYDQRRLQGGEGATAITLPE